MKEKSDDDRQSGLVSDDNDELDEILKDLMALQFRTERLGSRLNRKFHYYRHKADVYYSEVKLQKLRSVHRFAHGRRIYEILIDVEKVEGVASSGHHL